MRPKLILIFVLTVGLLPAVSPAFYFRLDGDRLWLQADQTPLVDILQQFAHAGVEVRLDPRLRSTLTGTVQGEDLDQALERLLESSDYLLTWKMLRGPLGRVPKLKEIQVFTPGEPSATRPIPSRPTVLETTRGVLGNAPEFVKDELLIGVRPGTTYPRFQGFLDDIGGMIVEADAATGIYLIRFPPGTNVEALLQQIARHPFIARAEPNYITRLPRFPSPASADGPAHPPASPPSDGSLPVAVLDSGLNPAAGLSPLVSAGWDAMNSGQALSDPAGHGTQMALLASGVLSADGLSPADETLPLVPIRAFDEEGKTSNFAIVQALSYAAEAGAKVVNMSWGSETDSEFMRTAMHMAASRGLTLVAAAGNTPTGTPLYPAAYPDVIAVAAVTANGTPWTSSNRGDFVEVSAPATATFPEGAFEGTSISSATVAGALARYFNRNPGASPAEALEALRKSLSPPPAEGFGLGVLDAPALLRLLPP